MLTIVCLLVFRAPSAVRQRRRPERPDCAAGWQPLPGRLPRRVRTVLPAGLRWWRPQRLPVQVQRARLPLTSLVAFASPSLLFLALSTLVLFVDVFLPGSFSSLFHILPTHRATLPPPVLHAPRIRPSTIIRPLSPCSCCIKAAVCYRARRTLSWLDRANPFSLVVPPLGLWFIQQLPSWRYSSLLGSYGTHLN